LGYYIFPLVAVMLGYLIFRENLRLSQWAGVGLALAAVVVLTVGLGVAPYISLILAFSFGFYGMVKKQMDAGPVVSVTAEVMVIAPASLVWILGVHNFGWTDFTGRSGAVFGQHLWDSLLLIASGAVTAVPLILFSYASRRVSYSTIGVVQYSNPTMQFFLAAFVFGEVITGAHMIAFTLIWIAVILYSLAAIRQERQSRRAVAARTTSGSTVM